MKKTHRDYKGKNNPHWKGGLSNCINCGKKLSSYNNKRCSDCWYKFNRKENNSMFGIKRFGKENPNFKNGNRSKKFKFYCKKCGKKLSSGRATYCMSCSKSGKNHPFFGKKRPEHSKKMSGKNCYLFGKRLKIGKIKYKLTYFRSGWEANFAKWCDLSGIKWEYENKTFDLGNTTYTPDFYLPEFDCYIEIKGYLTDYAKNKLKLFFNNFPSINFKLLQIKQLKNLSII